MSVEFGIHDKIEIEYSVGRPSFFRAEFIFCLLLAVDAFTILLSGLVSGIGYQLLNGGYVPEILPLCAVGVLTSLIYILRMNGSGYYELQEGAKPRLEVREILVCWFTTGLLLALIAFLLKISAAYSRGAFIVFYLLSPIALLGARQAAKIALARAVARGAIGGGDTVLIGDFNEMAALKSGELLALCGATEVSRFTLSREDDPLTRSAQDVQVIEAASSFVRRHNCRQILIALPWGDVGRIEFVRDQIKTVPVVARLLPDTRVRALSDLTWSERKRVAALELQRAPLSEAQRFVKRAMDVVVAAFALAFFLPIMRARCRRHQDGQPGSGHFPAGPKGI